ncbi:hypothetical protein [Aureimonas glaciei]|uniref:Uncharacterized protein n=1 Tax=Aureimonas glaciei TaxID=1776957 RepID=A0A916XTW0_9HYPH|nr:hypothetical protein [Aureimonas glaciei]GGD09644.1 hypothetical protein GCM10011335_10690 [Aureimonas glaciei]
MADLSAVLRKTIDGLPRASADLRAKVYEKARSAIERQIASASPPLSESVIEARRSALADAIDRTEDHYLELEAGTHQPTAEKPAAEKPAAEKPAAAPAEAKPSPERPAAEKPPTDKSAPPEPARPAPPAPTVAGAPMPRADRGIATAAPGQGPARPAAPAPSSLPSAQKPAWPKVAVDPASGVRRTDAASEGMASKRLADAAGPSKADRTGPADGRTGIPSTEPRLSGERRDPPVNVLKPQPAQDRTEPESGLDSIPAADIAAPRYANNGRRSATPNRNRTSILAGLAVLLVGGGATLAYVYREDLQALLISPDSETTTVAATAPSAAPSPATAPVTTPPASAVPLAGTEPPAEATGEGEAAAAGEAAVEEPLAGQETAALAPDGEEPAAAPAPASARRFTQRLLPDGTEVDEGPGTPDANAFDEGTNIAAASPPDTSATLAPAVPPPAAPTETPTVPETAAAPAATETQTAALPPATVAGAPAVAQKAVFYEERTEAEQGSQQAGNVVWSVVNESPSEGQPPEAAIRAVADIPERNLKLTMTIRRNADATLPASHVIELMFDVPENFAGGQIANVQRLALKPTEEARGEPLIGVAGQISDGFFIIALNNLEQATKTNLELMGREEWIDIPIAYATGRRALISIDKGIPGDRAFKEAMEAWAAKG